MCFWFERKKSICDTAIEDRIESQGSHPKRKSFVLFWGQFKIDFFPLSCASFKLPKEIWHFFPSHLAKSFPTCFAGNFYSLKSLKLSDSVINILESSHLCMKATLLAQFPLRVFGSQWKSLDFVYTINISYLWSAKMPLWRKF